MKHKQTWLVVIAAALSGFIGGSIPTWLSRSVFAAQAGQDSAKALRAARLEIVDRRGNIRAVFDTQSNGEPRLLLGSESKGVVLSSSAVVVAKDGMQDMAFLGWLSTEQGVELRLKSPYENVTLGGMMGALGFQDQSGHLRALFGNVSVPPSPTKNLPGLVLFSNDDIPRAMVAVTANGEGAVSLADSRGKTAWAAP